MNLEPIFIPIMLALCSMLLATCYVQNYTGIIGWSFSIPEMLVSKIDSIFSLKTVGFQFVHKISLITECKGATRYIHKMPILNKPTVCKAQNGFLYGFLGVPLVYCECMLSIGFDVF